MEDKGAKDVAATLAASMDNTQKNATNIVGPTQQVLSLCGKDLHDKTVSAILADDDTDMAEKLKLIHRENADYDRRQKRCVCRVTRLQNAQTQNVGIATNWWSENWLLLAFAGASAYAICTPQGRKVVKTITRRLVA